MTSPTIAEYLSYANLQMAAEAFIRDESTGVLQSTGDLYAAALVRGNDHSSRFVASQGEKFSGEWEVLDQRANTKTGFSGTLFRRVRDDSATGARAGELVLSFRSTEFIDDAARDNKATNELEIKETGFAWGQIADMQQWYAELKEGDTKLGAGQAFSVTGYSLGGHLATVFNLLNAGAAQRVVTFNGAGVGLVKDGTLQDALKEFNELRTSPDLLAARFTHPGLATFYRRIQTELASGQTTVAQAQADLNALYTDANTGVTVLGSQATTLMKALKGIEALGNEAVRVTTLVAGGSENSNASPKPVQAKDIAGMDLNYRLAMLFAGGHTQSASLVAGAVQGFGGKQYAGSLLNQYDVVGDTRPSVVANSQWHYGQDVRVGIEDQPLYRGGIGAGILMDAIALKSPDLLVNQYAVKDFGDTHSLVLLVDSLSLQNTLLSLMPEGERNAESVQSLLKTIYRAATNQKRVDGDLLSGGSQGKAEGDLLEQMVNALADMVLGPQDKAKQLKGNPSGGTWARTKAQDSYTGREKFFEIVEAIQGKIKESSLGSQFNVLASAGRSLDREARASFGDYLALRLLSPFVLQTKQTPQNVLDDMATNWGAVYDDWNADRALQAQGKSSNGLHVSDQWLADRLGMLERKNWFNTENKESWDLSYAAPNDPRRAASPYQLEDTFYEDLDTDYKIRQGQITDATRHFLFGDERDNTLTGRGVVDHLYGDAGNDTLSGLGGNDYLEGGSGTDTYRFEGSFGKDNLSDQDGLGVIQIDGKAVGQGKSAGKANTWVVELEGGQKVGLTVYDDAASSTGKKLVIARAGSTADTVTINNFDLAKAQSPVGYLGIQLDPSVKVALRDTLGANPFEDYAFDTASLSGSVSIQEHGGKPFALYLNRAAKAGDTITLALSELKDKFKAILGDVTVPADGAVITLHEGQTQVVFALVQEGAEVDASGVAQLKATYQGQPEPGQGPAQAVVAVSNTWGVELSDVLEATRTKNGDQRAPIVTLENGKQAYRWDAVEWSADGTLVNGVAEANFNDLLKGWDGVNDRLNGLGGNDGLGGGSGDDELHGGEGDDLLAGGNGSDVLYGDAGNDYLLTADVLTASQRRYVDDKPDVPAGETLMVDGGSWGVSSPDGGEQRNIIGADFATRDSASDVAYGGDGDDRITGGKGADYLSGDAGNDSLWGMDGQDVLHGGDGEDKIFGDGVKTPNRFQTLDGAQHGNDFIDGGAGNDIAFGQGGSDALYGGLGDDVLTGDDSDESELAATYHGDDYLNGEEGADTLIGGGRGDVLVGGEGADQLWGDDEAANLSGAHHGNDHLDGGAGADGLVGGGGNDTLLGGGGDDQLAGDDPDSALGGQYHGQDYLDGGVGADVLVGGGKDDVLIGGADNDYLDGDAEGAKLSGIYHGDDDLDGGAGDDTVLGQGGNDSLRGGDGNDHLEGDRDGLALASEFHGADHIDGGAGNDEISGDGGDDVLLGGDGDDWIAGEDETQVSSVSALTGNDRIAGGAGNDTLVGGNGNDDLAGDEGDDALYGGAGDDQLDGGMGRNVLMGGAGDDVYAVTSDGTHFVTDSEGRNLVVGVEGLAVAPTLQGDLVFSSAARTVVLTGALHGGFSGSILADGQEMSVEDYVLGNVTAPITLAGNADNQYFSGGLAGDDVVANGAGAQVRGGKGNDQVTFNNTGGRVVLDRGDGRDKVFLAALASSDAVATNKLGVQLGGGIGAGDVSFEYDVQANLLRLRYSPDPEDVLEVTYGGLLPPSVVDAPPIGEVRLADGTVLGFDFKALSTDEDTAYLYQLPANALKDISSDAVVSAGLAGGQPLPAWLHFNPTTRTFAGTPANGDVGALSVLVKAEGGGATAAYAFALVVRNVNDAPEAGAPLAVQECLESKAWTYDLPLGAFADVDRGDVLAYTARLQSGEPLPSWLSIDEKTGRLSHVGGYAQATRLNIVISATDATGVTALQPLQLTVRSALDSQAILGTPENDAVTGTQGNDLLIGGQGDDVLDGSGGNDLLIGGNSGGGANHFGQGRDTYLFGRGDGYDVIWNGKSADTDSVDTLKFKAGIKPEDIIVSRGPATIPVTEPDLSYRTVPDAIIFTVRDTGETISVPNFHTAKSLGAGRIDMVTFTDHPGVTWDAEAVSRLALIGTEGNDEIRGYATDDVLRGNGGADRLWGQWGSDIYQFGKNDGKDVIYEASNEGVDRIVFDKEILPTDVEIQKSLDINLNPVLIVRVLSGSTEITIPDFFRADLVAGIDAIEFYGGIVWSRDYIMKNVVGGSAVADDFVGTARDDHYVVDHPQDRIIEQVDGGVDSVESGVNYVLPQNVENLTLTGYLSINGTGNSLSNIIVGNNAANVLDWGGSAGSLYGSLQTEGDVLRGGMGGDVYKINAPQVGLYQWTDTDVQPLWNFKIIEATGEGVDELQTNAFSAVLPDNLENLTVSSFFAGAINYSKWSQRLVAHYQGNDLDNVLNASAVSSGFIPIELDGGLGNDLLMGSEQGGQDWASYESATAGVRVSLALSGAQDTGSAGRDTLQAIENLKGSGYADMLDGDAQNNTLDGGAGADRLAGAQGNDIYVVDDLGDTVVELADGGNDQVRVKGLASYVLPAYVESGEIQASNGTATITLQGNEEGNSLTIKDSLETVTQVILKGLGGDDYLQFVGSSSATATLDGGDGDDFLIGHGGADVFIGGRGDDTFMVSRWAGKDVIKPDEFAPNSLEINTLQLDEVSLETLVLRREGLHLRIGSGSDQVLVEEFFNEAGGLNSRGPVQRFKLTTSATPSGQFLDAAEILPLVQSNQAPTVQMQLDVAAAEEGQWFTWTLPYNAFHDDGERLTYSAMLEDGSPLPAWLSFDRDNQRLSGMVRSTTTSNGLMRVRITATDEEGLGASAVLEVAIQQEEGRILQGTDESDVLAGGEGNDVLQGLGGNDQLQGRGRDDRLEGGLGDDSLFGQDGADTLVGGPGKDFLSGGSGNDTFEYTKGDGQDTLDATDMKSASDKLLIHGWLPAQVQLLRSGSHLFLRMGSTDQIALYNYFQADSVQNGVPVDGKIDQIVFDGGELWDQVKIAALLAGGGGGSGSTGPGNPPPSTYAYAYVLPDQYSDFTLSGNAPYVMKGNGRANRLVGNDGANVINGAAGNDTLTGGKGGDTYFMEVGTGQDTIVEDDSTSGAVDLLQWGSGIRHDQIWLRKSGSNLEVSVIGTSDKAIVKDWYLGSSRRVEQIWADGKVLTDTKVQALVDAMAAFSPPQAGQTTLPSSQQAVLMPVIAANWQ